MRLVFITQDDPFYLPKVFEYLLPKLKNEGYDIAAVILFDVAPFGKKKSKIKQLFDTYQVFGLVFTAHYVGRYIKSLFSKMVADVMRQNDVEVIRIGEKINHPKSIGRIKGLKPDLLISLAGNEIFKRALFESSKYGVINLHSALLPKYRGLMPSFWVMRHNEKNTGVSVFFVDEGIDSGPILIQKVVPLLDRTQAELIWELKYRGADAIVESCILISKYGSKVPTIKNDMLEMSYYSRPTKMDVKAFKSLGKKFF